MATTKASRRAMSQRGAVPDDACPKCGTLMVERKRTLQAPVNRTLVPVPHATHLRCPQCDEVVLRLEDATALREKALALYRQRERLLSPEEIHEIRQRFRLTSARLAVLLRSPVRLVERWEAGRLAQPPVVDSLLRVMRDVPGSVAVLKKSAA